MSSKHTPGPWGLSKHIEVWVNAGPVHVATIPRAWDADWSEANAYLIAAAPDLLTHLVRVVSQFNALENNLSEADILVIGEARAAIAKATGKDGTP